MVNGLLQVSIAYTAVIRLQIWQNDNEYRILENFGGGKLWRMGKTTNWQKKHWRISEIVCQQVKLAISER